MSNAPSAAVSSSTMLMPPASELNPSASRLMSTEVGVLGDRPEPGAVGLLGPVHRILGPEHAEHLVMLHAAETVHVEQIDVVELHGPKTRTCSSIRHRPARSVCRIRRSDGGFETQNGCLSRDSVSVPGVRLTHGQSQTRSPPAPPDKLGLVSAESRPGAIGYEAEPRSRDLDRVGRFTSITERGPTMRGSTQPEVSGCWSACSKRGRRRPLARTGGRVVGRSRLLAGRRPRGELDDRHRDDPVVHAPPSA